MAAGSMREEVLEQLKKVDLKGNSGIIDRAGLTWVFRRLDKNAWTPEKINMLLDAVDRKRDGLIRYKELVDWVYQCEEYSGAPGTSVARRSAPALKRSDSATALRTVGQELAGQTPAGSRRSDSGTAGAAQRRLPPPGQGPLLGSQSHPVTTSYRPAHRGDEKLSAWAEATSLGISKETLEAEVAKTNAETQRAEAMQALAERAEAEASRAIERVAALELAETRAQDELQERSAEIERLVAEQAELSRSAGTDQSKIKALRSELQAAIDEQAKARDQCAVWSSAVKQAHEEVVTERAMLEQAEAANKSLKEEAFAHGRFQEEAQEAAALMVTCQALRTSEAQAMEKAEVAQVRADEAEMALKDAQAQLKNQTSRAQEEIDQEVEEARAQATSEDKAELEAREEEVVNLASTHYSLWAEKTKLSDEANRLAEELAKVERALSQARKDEADVFAKLQARAKEVESLETSAQTQREALHQQRDEAAELALAHKAAAAEARILKEEVADANLVAAGATKSESDVRQAEALIAEQLQSQDDKVKRLECALEAHDEAAVEQRRQEQEVRGTLEALRISEAALAQEAEATSNRAAVEALAFQEAKAAGELHSERANAAEQALGETSQELSSKTSHIEKLTAMQDSLLEEVKQGELISAELADVRLAERGAAEDLQRKVEEIEMLRARHADEAEAAIEQRRQEVQEVRDTLEALRNSEAALAQEAEATSIRAAAEAQAFEEAKAAGELHSERADAAEKALGEQFQEHEKLGADHANLQTEKEQLRTEHIQALQQAEDHERRACGLQEQLQGAEVHAAEVERIRDELSVKEKETASKLAEQSSMVEEQLAQLAALAKEGERADVAELALTQVRDEAAREHGAYKVKATEATNLASTVMELRANLTEYESRMQEALLRAAQMESTATEWRTSMEKHSDELLMKSADLQNLSASNDSLRENLWSEISDFRLSMARADERSAAAEANAERSSAAEGRLAVELLAKKQQVDTLEVSLSTLRVELTRAVESEKQAAANAATESSELTKTRDEMATERGKLHAKSNEAASLASSCVRLRAEAAQLFDEEQKAQRRASQAEREVHEMRATQTTTAQDLKAKTEEAVGLASAISSLKGEVQKAKEEAMQHNEAATTARLQVADARKAEYNIATALQAKTEETENLRSQQLSMQAKMAKMQADLMISKDAAQSHRTDVSEQVEQEAAMGVLLRTLARRGAASAAQAFAFFKPGKDRTVSTDRMLADIQRLQVLPPVQCRRFIEGLDPENTGRIHYRDFRTAVSTFLASSPDYHAALPEDHYNAIMHRIQASIQEKHMTVADAFRAWDYDGTGALCCNEFVQGLRSLRIGLSEKEIVQIFNAMAMTAPGDSPASSAVSSATRAGTVASFSINPNPRVRLADFSRALVVHGAKHSRLRDWASHVFMHLERSVLESAARRHAEPPERRQLRFSGFKALVGEADRSMSSADISRLWCVLAKEDTTEEPLVDVDEVTRHLRPGGTPQLRVVGPPPSSSGGVTPSSVSEAPSFRTAAASASTNLTIPRSSSGSRSQGPKGYR